MKKATYQNVCGVIVAADVCIGCGICAAVCPVHVLEMRFNEYGEFVPVEARSGCLPCPICLQACPFWTQEDDENSLAESAFGGEPGIQHCIEIGYYLKSLVGHVSDPSYRLSRSSGGLATWLQQAYLEKGLADFAIGVIPNEDPNRLFRYAVLDSVEKVRLSAKSAYYPVEISDVIKHVLEFPGRYMVTGVPCFLKGLRLAMRHNPKLRKRIVCTIGLVCGQAKSKFFAEYLTAMGGGDPANTQRVDFRHKDPAHLAIEYAFGFEMGGTGGTESKTAFCSPEIRKESWNRSYFKPNACNFCDDVFAEVADIGCMDAWLPEYNRDWQGHSIALVRSAQVFSVIRDGIETGQLAIKEIEIEQAIKSQEGGMTDKRQRLANRLYLHARQDHAYIPQKRVGPQKPTLIERWKLSSQERMRALSRQAFYALGDHRDAQHISRFHSQMSTTVRLDRVVRFVDRLVHGLPRKIARLTHRSPNKVR